MSRVTLFELLSYLQLSSPSGVSGLGSNAIAVHRSCSYFCDLGQSGSYMCELITSLVDSFVQRRWNTVRKRVDPFLKLCNPTSGFLYRSKFHYTKLTPALDHFISMSFYLRLRAIWRQIGALAHFPVILRRPLDPSSFPLTFQLVTKLLKVIERASVWYIPLYLRLCWVRRDFCLLKSAGDKFRNTAGYLSTTAEERPLILQEHYLSSAD